MTEADWVMTGVYFATLMAGGTLLMSVLARKNLSRLKQRGH